MPLPPITRQPYSPDFSNTNPIDPKTERLMKKLDNMAKQAEQPRDGAVLEPLKTIDVYKHPGIPDLLNPGGRIEMDGEPVVTDVTPDPDSIPDSDGEDLDPDTSSPVEGGSDDPVEEILEAVADAVEDAVETVSDWWDSLFGSDD